MADAEPWGLSLHGRTGAGRAWGETRVLCIERRDQWSVYLSFAGELRFVHVPYQTERVAERQWLITQAEHAWALAIETRHDLPDAIARYPIFRVDGQWPRI